MRGHYYGDTDVVLFYVWVFSPPGTHLYLRDELVEIIKNKNCYLLKEKLMT